MKSTTLKRALALLLAAVLLGGILTACGGKPDAAPDGGQDGASAEAPEGGGGPGAAAGLETGDSGKGKTIGFSIAQLAGNPFWQVMLDRLVAGYEAKGYEVKYTDAGGDVSTQLTDLQTFISMGVDAIVVNPYASDSVVDVSLEAEKAGIPVFAVDIPVSDSGYSIATFICDNWSLGYQHGLLAASLFPDTAVDAIILSGYAGGEDSWDRRFGFTTGLADYQVENHSSTGFRVLYQCYCNYEQEMAYEKMVDIITRFNGDFDVVFCENDAMALGAITALEEAGLNPADYIIMSIDGIRQSYESIKAGKLYATGVNSPIDVADLAVRYVDAYLGGDTSVSGTYYTEYTIVTAENVDAFYDPNSLY